MASLRRPRSSSDASDSARPTRRQRLQLEPSSETPAGPLIRDEKFYKERGDCYIQVEIHLFKIHRYHLTRGDASVFNDMFLLPSGEDPCQGSSESDPIVLAGDSAEQFRGFLTIAYSEPLEFQMTRTQLEQVPTLIHCAHFSHKYNITPLLLAALDAIVYVLGPQPALESKTSISLLELSKLCGTIHIDQELSFEYKIRSAVEWGWVAVCLHESNLGRIAEVLDIGEAYKLQHLLAFGYASYLENMGSCAEEATAQGVHSPFQAQPWLKPVHRIRILSGLWSQERAWSHFAATIPSFPEDHRCSKMNHATSCVLQWGLAFRRAVNSPSVLAVPLGGFARRRLVLERELKPAFASTCISTAFNLEELLGGLGPGYRHFTAEVFGPD
ncbi:hypothetical protein K438DRAFT_2031199 [Mycena galopus ATCC 62051]|nr:hypothetical protein K438DRAFT_2031199 [Mycena galopus ATCC 62051]